MPSPFTAPNDYASVQVDGETITGRVYNVRDNGWLCVETESGRVASGPSPTVSERIRAARRAQLVAHYDANGWPLALVQLLNDYPLVSLSEALDGFTIPVRKVA